MLLPHVFQNPPPKLADQNLMYGNTRYGQKFLFLNILHMMIIICSFEVFCPSVIEIKQVQRT